MPSVPKARSQQARVAILALGLAGCAPDSPAFDNTDAGGDAGAGGQGGSGGVDASTAGSAGQAGTGGSSGGPSSWVVTAGDGPADRAREIALDADGNLYVVGEFGTQIDWGDGPRAAGGDADLFVVSFDPSGAVRWSDVRGGTGADRAYSVVVGERVFVGGVFVGTVPFGTITLTAATNDGFVSAYDSIGAHRWAIPVGVGDGDGEVNTLRVVPGGVQAGVGFNSDAYAYEGAPLFAHGGGWDFLVATISNLGKPSGETQYSDDGNESIFGLASMPNGDTLISGNYSTAPDFAPFANPPLKGDYDGMVLRLGVVEWLSSWASSGLDSCKDGTYWPEADVVVARCTVDFVEAASGLGVVSQGDDDALLVALDPDDGTPRWARGIGTPEADKAASLTITPDGVLLSVARGLGEVKLTGGGTTVNLGQGAGFWLGWFDPAGALVRSLSVQGTHKPSEAVVRQSATHVYVAGGFTGQLATPAGNIEAMTGYDAFVLGVALEELL